jgi:hypothetical protein
MPCSGSQAGSRSGAPRRSCLPTSLAWLRASAGLSRVFGELAQAFCPRADHLIWLDLDWATCERSLLQRGPQSATHRDAQAAEASFERLLAWAAEYPHRDGPHSQRGHRLIFEQFQGGKTRLATRTEVTDFVAALADR